MRADLLEDSLKYVEKIVDFVWSVVRQKNEREYQGEGVQDSGKTGTGVRGIDVGIEEGTEKEIGDRRNANATMDVWSYEAGQDKGPFKCYVTQMGVGGGGVRFSGKKRFEGVRFNVICITRGWVGVQFPEKSVM